MTKITSPTERVFEKENSPTQEVLTYAHKLIALHYNDVAGKDTVEPDLLVASWPTGGIERSC